MRKVCSAPGSLHNLASSKTHEGANQHARMPKSTSTGSFGNAKKSYGGLKRKGSGSSSLKPTAFLIEAPLAFLDAPRPEAEAMEEELVASSRGLAGLECLELYGPEAIQTAPSIHGDNSPLDKGSMLASCLATPLTGEDKNLGEIVEGEARRLLSDAQRGVEEQYLNEVKRNRLSVVAEEAVASLPDEDTKHRRKRRNSEDDWERLRDKRAHASFPARTMSPESREIMASFHNASLDEESNRLSLDADGLLCYGDFCFPYAEPDESLFKWSRLPAPSLSSDIAHSV